MKRFSRISILLLGLLAFAYIASYFALYLVLPGNRSTTLEPTVNGGSAHKMLPRAMHTPAPTAAREWIGGFGDTIYRPLARLHLRINGKCLRLNHPHVFFIFGRLGLL